MLCSVCIAEASHDVKLCHAQQKGTNKEWVNAGLVDHMTMSGSAEQLALDLAREIAQARSHVFSSLLHVLMFMANSML